MKNIVLVVKNSVAVAMVNNNNVNQYKAYQSTNSNLAILNALLNVIEAVPTNDDLSAETRRVVLATRHISAFATGSWKDVVKTGKNSEGKQLPKEEHDLWVKVATLYAERCFNIRFITHTFVGKNDQETKTLINSAWEMVKAEASKVQMAPQQTQQQVPAQDPVAMIGLQIAEAAAKGDMATVATLTQALSALKAAGAQAPVVEEPVQEDYMEVDDMEFE